MSRWLLTRTLWNNVHWITKLNLAQSLHIYFKSLIRSATKTFIVALNQNLGWLCSLTFSKCNDIWSILVFLDLKKQWRTASQVPIDILAPYMPVCARSIRFTQRDRWHQKGFGRTKPLESICRQRTDRSEQKLRFSFLKPQNFHRQTRQCFTAF